jgi:integrase
MGVYKRSGSPNWIIDFVYKGERHKFSSGTSSKREAQAMEAKHREELRGQVVHGKVVDLTLAEAMKRYAATVVKLNKSDGKRELSAFKRLGDYFGADTLLSRITTASISEFQLELLEEDELQPASVNRYTDVLKAILNKAHDEWNALAKMPVINSLKVQNAKLRFIDEEEERRLKEAVPLHVRRLITFLVGTGGRRGETLKLTWGDVDLASNKRAAVRFLDTKSGNPRRVPLPNSVRDLLATMKAERGNPSPKDPVFTWTPAGTDQPIAYENPRKAFDNARTRVGLRDVTLHTLRHTYASRLVMKGVPIFQVSKLLGHSKIQMTMRYSHLAPEGLDDAVSALDD